MADTTQTFLLVDNCLEDRIIYTRYLLQEKPHSCIIIEAQTGKEALSLCKQQFPDVILLNYDLPDMDGLELLGELKIQFERTHFPVIILTEGENLEIAVEVLKNGAAEYLVKKNLTPESLSLAFENVMEKQSGLGLAQFW